MSIIRSISIRILFEPRDLFMGVYWKIDEALLGKWLIVYVLILPMLPIRFTFRLRREGE